MVLAITNAKRIMRVMKSRGRMRRNMVINSKVSLGSGHVLALTVDRKLFGWGYCAEGRLGRMGEAFETCVPNPAIDSSTTSQQISSSTIEVAEKLVSEAMEREKNMPIIWEPCLLEEVHGVEVVDMACGLDHSLVLFRNGTLLSGGANTYYQLGREAHGSKLLPVEINLNPVSVAAGLGHSFVICEDDKSLEADDDAKIILSWGWNRNSQLGRSGREAIPLVVEGLAGENPVSVSGGRVHSLALTSTSEVWAWGCGRSGRLGLGHSADESVPSLLECLEDVKVLQAVSGFDHNLILAAV